MASGMNAMLRQPILALFAFAPCAAFAALPGEMPARPVVALTPMTGLSAPALGAPLQLVVAAPALSLPSAPSPLPVVLPLSLPGVATPARPMRLDPESHPLDWSFLNEGHEPETDLVPAPTPRPRSPSGARVRFDFAETLAGSESLADAVFDGAKRTLAVAGW